MKLVLRVFIFLFNDEKWDNMLSAEYLQKKNNFKN